MTLESPIPPTITDPAAASAAGKCLASRYGFGDGDSYHPRPCEWCKYGHTELTDLLDDFRVWAGYDERRGTYTEPEVVRFMSLPRQEQRLRSYRAAYGEDPLDPAITAGRD